jgi:PAS domain S-box-containing protein
MRMRGVGRRPRGGAGSQGWRAAWPLVVGYLVMAAIIMLASYWVWFTQTSSVRTQAERSVMAVSDLKAEEITRWLKEQRADAKALSSDPLFAKTAQRLERDPHDAGARAEIDDILRGVRIPYHYVDLVLVDAQGHTLARSPAIPGHPVGKAALALADEAMATRQVQNSDLYLDAQGVARFELAAPLLPSRPGAAPTTAVIVHADPAEYLYPLIRKWPLPNSSGETLLVEKNGSDVLFLSGLRYRAGTALRLRMPSTQDDLPAAMAVRGRHGVVQGKDYRGVLVLAAIQPISGTPWYIISKVDAGEVFGPVDSRAWIMGLFALAMLALTGAGTLLLWRSRERQVDVQLAEEEERYRSLFENMTEGVALHDLVRDEAGTIVDYRIVDVNPAFSKQTGLTAGEVKGHLGSEAYGTGEAPYLDHYVRAGRGEPQDFEFHFDPLGRDFAIGAVGYGDDSFATIFQDVTERKRHEEELRISEDRFRYVFDNALLGITMTYPEGRVDVNRAFCDMLGYSAEEMAQKRWQDVTPPEDVPGIEARLDAVISGSAASARFVRRFIRKDGRIRWADVSTTLRRDAEGNPEYFVTAIMDITEVVAAHEEVQGLNRRLERRVEERTAELHAANQELEAFAYSVSHDLRAPLRHISGFSALLAERAAENLDERSRHYLDVIAKSVTEMGALIDDLLHFSRTGRAELKIESVDMDDVVEEVLATLRSETEDRDIEWAIGDLPAADADRALIRQVWANLLDNAVKYTRGVSPARISVHGERSDGEVVYEVCDNGVGFDMQYAHKLFGVFQRLHDASQFEGTGIGLANVHRIVTRLHGKVWAEGEPGNGATFSFSLPKNREAR